MKNYINEKGNKERTIILETSLGYNVSSNHFLNFLFFSSSSFLYVLRQTREIYWKFNI